MKKFLIPFVALSAVVALPLIAQDKKNDSASTQEEKKGPEPLKVGSTVDEKTELKGLDGKNTDFKALRGKVVIVHFWSDRCPAEIHADPVFKKLEGYYADKKDVVIIGIASNQGELGAEPAKDADYSKAYPNLKKKIGEVGYKHSIYADHGNKLSDYFQAKSTPHCYVIDAKGVVSYAGALDDDLRGDKGDKATVYVRDAADALAAGKAVETKETKPYG